MTENMTSESTSICKRFQNLHQSMVSLREHNNTINNTLCSIFNVADISSVSGTDFKTCNKLSKQVMGDYLLTSIKLTNSVCSPTCVLI